MKSFVKKIIGSVAILCLVGLNSSVNSQTTLNFTVTSPVHAESDFSVDYKPDRLTFVFWDSSSTNIVSWYWDFGDSTSSILQNTNHTYTEKGIYNVCLAVVNDRGCVDTSCQELNSWLGIKDPDKKELAILVYPNPSSGKVNLEFKLSQQSDVQLDVYDLIGNRIKSLNAGELNAGIYKYELLSSDFHNIAGVYLIELVVDGKVSIEKLVLTDL